MRSSLHTIPCAYKARQSIHIDQTNDNAILYSSSNRTHSLEIAQSIFMLIWMKGKRRQQIKRIVNREQQQQHIKIECVSSAFLLFFPQHLLISYRIVYVHIIFRQYDFGLKRLPWHSDNSFSIKRNEQKKARKTEEASLNIEILLRWYEIVRCSKHKLCSLLLVVSVVGHYSSVLCVCFALLFVHIVCRFAKFLSNTNVYFNTESLNDLSHIVNGMAHIDRFSHRRYRKKNESEFHIGIKSTDGIGSIEDGVWRNTWSSMKQHGAVPMNAMARTVWFDWCMRSEFSVMWDIEQSGLLSFRSFFMYNFSLLCGKKISLILPHI